MRRSLVGLVLILALVAGVRGALHLKDARIAFGPMTGFSVVPADRLPGVARPFVASVRTLDPLAARPVLSDAVQARVAAKGGSDFPILVPVNLTGDDMALAASRFRIELLDEGYYAILQSADMELMIMGTAIVHHAEGREPAGLQNDYLKPFQDPGPRPAGGRITFGAFGADFSITFDCKRTDPGLKTNCISGAEARALVEALKAGVSTGLKPQPFEGS